MRQLQGMEGGELRQHILTSPSTIKAGRYGREALLSHPLKAGIRYPSQEDSYNTFSYLVIRGQRVEHNGAHTYIMKNSMGIFSKK